LAVEEIIPWVPEYAEPTRPTPSKPFTPPALCIKTTWYLDEDGDGIGGPWGLESCLPPPKYVESYGDCDDHSPAVRKSRAWYVDFDGDGYGNTGGVVHACTQPSGFAAKGGDADDGAPKTW